MPDLRRKELEGHQARSQPEVSPWIATPVAVALLLASVLLAAYLRSGLPRVGKPRVPPVLILPFAVVSALLGLVLLTSLVSRYVRARRARRLARSHPGEPWLGDHWWNPRGIGDDTLPRALQSLGGALLFGLFLIPFNWLAFFSRGELGVVGRVFFGLVTGVFDALVIALFVYGLYLLVRLATYGASFLRFERFPFQLGRPLATSLRVGRKGVPDRPLVATLRCIEESYESRGSESASTACYELYADTRRVAPPFTRTPRAWEARFEFDLPAAPLETRLAARPPRYWELEVRSEASVVDYAATFLVPVYGAPGAGGAPQASSADRT